MTYENICNRVSTIWTRKRASINYSNRNASIVGLTIEIDNRTLTSVFKKKDEAFKEYTEALKRNDVLMLLDQSERSDDTFVLSVGRLPPGKECKVSISYVTTLESVTETKSRLTIPTSLYPRYDPTPKLQKTGVVAPETFQSTVSYKATLSGHIQAVDTIENITSPTHPLSVTTVGPKEASVTFNGTQQALDKDLVIEVELKKNPQSYVEVEETSPGVYTAMYAFVPSFKPDNSGINSELIFVVDCSGSMSDENKIDDARRAVQIFLRSIPEGAYFNFYKFGSRFESLFPQSQLYSADTFAQAKAYADAINADLGGTEILEPLQKIYTSAPRSGFSRQIFVLTDGEVTNTQEVISLVRQNADNSRVFAFGLGQSPSRSLVNGIALAGNGKAEFIKHGEVLENSIGRQLARALQPSVTDVRVVFHGVTQVQQAPTVVPPVFKGDRQIVYAIFGLDKGDDATARPFYIELKIGQDKTKVPFTIPIKRSSEKPFLAQLAARELIRHLELEQKAPPRPTGSLQFGRHPSPVPSDNQTQESITALSLNFRVLSKYVSLVAVESRTGRNATSDKMELREVPIQKSMNPKAESYQSFGFASNIMMASPMQSFHRVHGFPGAPMPAMAGSFAFSSAGLSKLSSSASSSHRVQSHPSAVLSEADDFSEPIAGEQNQQADVMVGLLTSTTTEKPNSAATLNKLLNLQQWNGAWNLTEELARLSNVTVTEVHSAVPGLDDTVLGTLLAVTVVKERFAQQTDVWQAIINKATAFLDKQPDQAAIQSGLSALRLIIKRN
ncbi:von Willebrand factor A domain-containing protein [Hypsibius exemplaris]|uniref:von Willebrand factor A domain-containing protein n=1 Tax=Hypsibius exemplaris TaxID=2072580 RepID=A0A1W0WV98_HYPEX|nr:von Willebrand factor A domain-containing protein [Hypsibius exemplaris]